MIETFTFSPEAMLRSGILVNETVSDEGITLRPFVPSSHRFPILGGENAQRNEVSEVGFVDAVDPISQTRLGQLSKSINFSPMGDWVHDISPDAGGKWTIPRDIPPELVSIFKTALAHEAALYSDLSNRRCHVSVRLVDSDTYNEHWLKEAYHKPWKEGYSDIHFDEGHKRMSSYLVGSEPTTIFYGTALEGEVLDLDKIAKLVASREPAKVVEAQGVSAKSARAWHMFRINNRVLHSQPWEPMKNDERKVYRLLVRLAFSDK